MLKKMLLIAAALAAATTATATNPTSAQAPSWSTTNHPGVPQPEMIYVRVHRHVLDGAYVGLADRVVSTKVNGSFSKIPAGYEPVLSYQSGGSVQHVPLRNVKRFNIASSDAPGILTLRNGKEISVDVGHRVSLPTSACRVSGGQVQAADCVAATLAGSLVDLDTQNFWKGSAIAMKKDFDYLEVSLGAQARQSFAQATQDIDDYDRTNKVVRR